MNEWLERSRIGKWKPLPSFRIGPPRTAQDVADDDWYDSLGLALRIIRKHWDSDLTEDEDAFVLAFADEVSTRPVGER